MEARHLAYVLSEHWEAPIGQKSLKDERHVCSSKRPATLQRAPAHPTTKDREIALLWCSPSGLTDGQPATSGLDGAPRGGSQSSD